jgi:hypothetical protein
MQSGDSLRIKVTADIIVGETDTGGISFYFTPELKVTDILCSYSGDVTGQYLNAYHFFNADSKYRTAVDIAHRNFSPTFDGGYGTVVLDLQLSGHTALSDIDSLYFTVAVGGKEDIVGIVHEYINIPLLHSLTP